MRTVISVLLLLLSSAGTYAQTPQIDHIDVVDYGIYTANTESIEALPGTAASDLAIRNDIRHVKTTRTVPAQQGMEFGFRYVVVGAPVGTVVPLHMVTIFPSPGLRNPATRQIKAQSEYDRSKTIGTTSYRSYVLDNGWEVVAGIWTFQIWYQGRKLAEQKFTVAKH